MQPLRNFNRAESVTAPRAVATETMTAKTAGTVDVAALANRLIDQIERVVVGKRDVIELVIVALLCEGHILIEDVPGVGKTTLARAVARSLGGDFRRIQFTPDLLPTDIGGIVYFNQKVSDFQFRPGPIFANIVLADEINRATPRTQSALLEAMEERTVTIEGETMALPRPFLVLATENPIELEGTFPLPEAQLDRFLIRLAIGYPNHEQEDAILDRFRTGTPLTSLEPVATPEDLIAAAAAVREIHVADELRHYVTAIVRATREQEEIALGASPRGSLALFRAAQALAAIRQRDAVLPDDIKLLVPAILGHRIVLAPEARLRGRTTASLLSDILKQTPVPVEGDVVTDNAPVGG